MPQSYVSLDGYRIPEDAAKGEGDKAKLMTFQEMLEAATLQQDWVLRGFFPAGRLVTFAGPPKTAQKSLFLLAASRAISLGEPFMGLDTKRTTVVFSDLENGIDETAARCLSLGFDAAQSYPVRFSGEAAHIRPIYNKIADERRRVLWIIDSFAELATGALGLKTENDASEVTTLLRPFRQLCHKTGSTIVIVHHVNKAGGLRGSIAIQAGTDGTIYVEPQEDMTLKKVRIVLRSRNDKEVGAQWAYQVHEDGEQTTFTPAELPSDDGDDEGGHEGRASGSNGSRAPRGTRRRFDIQEVRARIFAALSEAGEDGLSTGAIFQAVHAKKEYVQQLLEELRREGYIAREGRRVKGSNHWVLHTVDADSLDPLEGEPSGGEPTGSEPSGADLPESDLLRDHDLPGDHDPQGDHDL